MAVACDGGRWACSLGGRRRRGVSTMRECRLARVLEFWLRQWGDRLSVVYHASCRVYVGGRPGRGPGRGRSREGSTTLAVCGSMGEVARRGGWLCGVSVPYRSGCWSSLASVMRAGDAALLHANILGFRFCEFMPVAGLYANVGSTIIFVPGGGNLGLGFFVGGPFFSVQTSCWTPRPLSSVPRPCIWPVALFLVVFGWFPSRRHRCCAVSGVRVWFRAQDLQ